jgi:hypothetical protein
MVFMLCVGCGLCLEEKLRSSGQRSKRAGELPARNRAGNE